MIFLLSQRFSLDLVYDSSKISLTKTPNNIEYEANTSVLVEATAYEGYVIDNTSINWASHSILMDEDKSFTISSYPDFNDNDGDGLSNYDEAVIYNSNLNNSDTDNDSVGDYFESIAKTSLTDANDYFYIHGSINSSGLYNLEFNSKSTRDYSIKISDDLVNWHNWKTEIGNDAITFNIFDPSVEIITD